MQSVSFLSTLIFPMGGEGERQEKHLKIERIMKWKETLRPQQAGNRVHEVTLNFILKLNKA